MLRTTLSRSFGRFYRVSPTLDLRGIGSIRGTESPESPARDDPYSRRPVGLAFRSVIIIMMIIIF